jgi:hypothetical protein
LPWPQLADQLKKDAPTNAIHLGVFSCFFRRFRSSARGRVM